MTDTYKIICKLISTAMFGSAISYDEDIDWLDVFNEMKAHGIASVVGDFIKNIPMEDKIKEQWQDSLLLQLLHWEKILSTQDEICRIFSEIPYAVLKGMSSALLYPNPRLRAMGDVDVLVTKENFDMACELLKENYFLAIAESGVKHNNYCKNGIDVEVHNSYTYRLLQIGKNAIENKVLAGINNSAIVSYDGHNWRILPEMERGLSLVYHFYNHFYGGPGFRQVTDWMMFVYNSGDIDWNEFNKITAKDGLYKLQCAVTKLCCIYFGLPETDSIKWMHDVDDQTCEGLFEYIAARGNFGNKVSDYEFGDQFALDNKVKGFFIRLQKGGMLRWKAAQKHKALRPFAWLYQIIRVSSIMISRKNPIESIRNDIDESKKLIKLYDGLGFERIDCYSKK